jgi:hypothetical protein
MLISPLKSIIAGKSTIPLFLQVAEFPQPILVLSPVLIDFHWWHNRNKKKPQKAAPVDEFLIQMLDSLTYLSAPKTPFPAEIFQFYPELEPQHFLFALHPSLSR